MQQLLTKAAHLVPLAVLVAAGACAPTPTTEVPPQPPATRPLPEGWATLENPIIRERFSSDPAALVHDGRVWLYTGHDEQEQDRPGFLMREWHLYSSPDMVNWTFHGSPISVATFPWALRDAWASHVVEKDGKFYFYSTVRHATINGFSIGVAVADRPEGPFRDARGSALITNDMTQGPIVNGREMDWDDIDPAVFIDDDGQAYIFWGNTVLRYAKLKDNMIELDGPIVDLDVPRFTEGPWVHKYNDTYYLTYAYDFPEKIAYATADHVTGPYRFGGVIMEPVPNSPTSHPSVIEFEGNWFMFYHNAQLPGGGEFRRSVAVERMFYDENGYIFPLTQARRGLAVSPPAGAVDTAAP
jgi:arabinoxylan arabinofuranohydrolase